MITLDRKKLDQICARAALLPGRGEEATKQALVLPLLDLLGYDIWNPAEVCPEHAADFATKKLGQKEKVDLAIVLDGVPRIYFECKAVEVVLDGHEGQLARYFNATPSVSLAVLTNGLEYRFYTDTVEPNLLDARPFHVFRLDAVDPALDVLSRFHRAEFSAEALRDYATELNHTASIVAFLREELDLREREPSEALIRWILGAEGLYDGRVTASVVDRFRPIAKNALTRVLREVVRRSVAALDDGLSAAVPVAPALAAPLSEPPTLADVDDGPPETDEAPKGRSVVTTDRELAAFEIIEGWFAASALASSTVFDGTARRPVPVELGHKDTQGYFGVYLNKPAWWFARLVLDARQPWVGVNLDPERVSALLPPGLSLLPPHPFAAARVAVGGVEDLRLLGPVVLAAMQQAIDARRPVEEVRTH